MERLEMNILQARARRAYEVGRWRAALRVMVMILPVVMLALLLGSSVELCACTALLVVPTAVMLRWYGLGFGAAATRGVLVGGAVSTGLLLACRLGWFSAWVMPWLAPVCAITGIALGAWLGHHAAMEREDRRLARVLTSAGVAGAMMSMGCAEVGIASMAAMVVALVVGALGAARLVPGRG